MPDLNPVDGQAEDLRDVLMGFWIESIREAPDYGDKIKASEMLAKYFLVDGRTRVGRRGVLRPPTADILRIATQLEQAHAQESEELTESDDTDGR